MVAVLGIVYILVLGYNLLVCFLSGIGPLPDHEVPLYITKCIIMALLLPALIYWFTVTNYYLSRQAEKNEDIKAEYERALEEYKQLLHLLENQHKALLKQHEITIAEMETLSRNKVARMRKETAYKSNEKSLIPLLISAYTGKQKLTEKEKRELIKYLEEL